LYKLVYGQYELLLATESAEVALGPLAGVSLQLPVWQRWLIAKIGDVIYFRRRLS
jgi:hypothetical protein